MRNYKRNEFIRVKEEHHATIPPKAIINEDAFHVFLRYRINN
jgi:hypothetical protein